MRCGCRVNANKPACHKDFYIKGARNMIVRDAKISDARALSEIYKYYVDNFPYSFEYTAPSAAGFGKRISDISGKFPFFICENNGEVVGFAYAHLFKSEKHINGYAKHPFTQSTDAHKKALVPCCMQNCFPQFNSRGLSKRMRFLAVPMKAARYFTKNGICNGGYATQCGL